MENNHPSSADRTRGDTTLLSLCGLSPAGLLLDTRNNALSWGEDRAVTLGWRENDQSILKPYLEPDPGIPIGE